MNSKFDSSRSYTSGLCLIASPMWSTRGLIMATRNGQAARKVVKKLLLRRTKMENTVDVVYWLVRLG